MGLMTDRAGRGLKVHTVRFLRYWAGGAERSADLRSPMEEKALKAMNMHKKGN